MINLLLVEDDNAISSSIKYFLEKDGIYKIDISNGNSNENIANILSKTHYSLAILDIALGASSGFEIFKKIKQIQNIPIIFLSALDDEISKIHGFELGADDYITKPFSSSELLYRIKAVLRRTYNISDEIIYKNIKVDVSKAKVYKNNIKVDLTSSEYKLLLILLQNKNKVMTRQQILSNLWDVSQDFVNDNTLTVYIKRLRQKLEDNQSSSIIKTVRGIGYIVGDYDE